ncbi:MAG: hypothetical protein HPY69_03110 [Armatimonadetes bacterium]|nr:hypothetical protein [Armatimonadota bacterium]
MNHAERFRAVMGFQPVDRLPRIEWASWWDKTVARWAEEGLPVTDRYEMYEYFGLDPYYQCWFGPRAAEFPGPEGGFPVTGHDDYDRIRPYLLPPFEETVESLRPWGEKQAQGECVVWVTIEGFFWYPRTLFGIEAHFYAFYDHADLMHRMNQELADYHVRLLKALAPVCTPLFVVFAEDMSYNHGPMLSKQLFDEFLAPYYRQVIPVVEEMGALVIVDSDGNITDMVPWMQGVGIQGVLPLERQAGVDGNALRAAFPDFRMVGHFDKMTMPHGEAAMREEFERLLPLMRSGGFIPGVDHQTPPGVSLEQYRVYLRLLEEYTVLGAQ